MNVFVQTLSVGGCYPHGVQRLANNHEGEFPRSVGCALAVVVPLALLLAALLCWSDSHL